MLRAAAVWCGFATAALAASCWRNTSCSGFPEASFPGPWEANIYSPASRSIHPKFVLSRDGEFVSEYGSETSITLDSSATSMVFDFGIEVGGIISFDYALTGSNTTDLGLAFTEAKDFIGPGSDSSRGGSGGRPGDGPLEVKATSGNGHYIMPDDKMRGGFRYLTIFLDTNATDVTLDLTKISLEISFQPTWADLRAYGGYFHSNDELLNKIWYSGAYTIQTNSVPGNAGQNPLRNEEPGWRNNAVITEDATVLLDGAKRDRFVWIGDMGVAVPSAFVSTGDLESTKYALLSIFDNQRSDGMFPKAGPPYVRWDSDAYHLWALIGTYNYYLYSGDTELLEELWPKYEAGLDYALSLLNSDHIVSVRGESDWGRFTSTKERSSISMLLYHALTTGADMAAWLPPTVVKPNTSETYAATAAALRDAIMDQFWDEDVGAFSESPKNGSLHPQDANSFALAYGIVVGGTTEASRVSDYLASTWTPVGPSCPELPDNVSPFISGVELEAHFRAERPDRSLDLMRTLWGSYLDNENGTQSTTPEGFLIDGTWGYRFNQGYTNGPAYMSHAHSWSSGPTYTLTELMVGLRVTQPAGKQWQLKPASFNELSSAEAGFTTTLGKFSAKFSVEGESVAVEWDTPEGTEGLLDLPGCDLVKVKGGKGKTTVPITDV